MTAGQRNCYIAICECVTKYSLDDVLFAVRTQVDEIGAVYGSNTAERRICNDVAKSLEQSRGWMRFNKHL